MDKGEKEMKEEINKIKKKKQNNSVGASKIKSRKFSLFCSRGILDVSRNRIKVNIIPSSLLNARYDTKSLIILKDSTQNLTYTSKLNTSIISIQAGMST